MKNTTDFKSNIRMIIKITILVFCAVVFTLGIFAVSREFIAIMIMVVSAAVAIITLFHKQFYAVLCKIRQYRFGRILIYTVIACIILATLYTAVISFLMLDAMSNTSPDVATLIVLGAQVIEDESSLILYRRMEVALQFLNANPQTVAVLSGGVGLEAVISEAEAMRRFLVSNGISEDMLFVEERSTTTRENIGYSSAIISEYSLSKNVAIVTDGFHQYRSQSFAKYAGLSPSALTSGTPFFSLPFYWVREIVAITTQVVFK